MSILTPARRSQSAAGLGLLFLMTLALATAALLGPGGTVAAEDRDGWAQGQAGPDGPGGGPEAGLPGNGTNASPAENAGVAGGATATTTSAVNLRSGPSMESGIIAVVPAGSAVQIAGGGKAGFVPVVFNGMNGFISGD